MKEKKSSAHFAIFAYRDVQQAAVLGLCDLFDVANRNSRACDGQTVKLQVVTPDDLAKDEVTCFDAVILPPSLAPNHDWNDVVSQNWLKKQHADGAVLCSVCAGAFGLGACGLLDGRAVTTHWMLEDKLQARFPKADVNSEHILIDDHDIVSAGGVMAWIDLGLFLVTRYLGQQITTLTARHLLIDPGGREQKNYRTFRPVFNHGDPAILKVQHILEKDYKTCTNIESLASLSTMSQRTFLRRFKAATGLTPNQYLQHLRIEKARGFLERTRQPISGIAWQVGYGDVSAFSRVFKEITGLKAGRYRERFNVLNFNE